jgi:hypothetical protein
VTDDGVASGPLHRWRQRLEIDSPLVNTPAASKAHRRRDCRARRRDRGKGKPSRPDATREPSLSPGLIPARPRTARDWPAGSRGRVGSALSTPLPCKLAAGGGRPAPAGDRWITSWTPWTSDAGMLLPRGPYTLSATVVRVAPGPRGPGLPGHAMLVWAKEG